MEGRVRGGETEARAWSDRKCSDSQRARQDTKTLVAEFHLDPVMDQSPGSNRPRRQNNMTSYERPETFCSLLPRRAKSPLTGLVFRDKLSF